MNNVDILIHLHPELSAKDRSKVENETTGCVGVLSAGFDHHKHPHALMVSYNADATSSKQILNAVRKYDPAASMVGL